MAKLFCLGCTRRFHIIQCLSAVFENNVEWFALSLLYCLMQIG
ncbi:hypothetical protein XFF1815_710001 [Xanthomonas citri pv. fuscans]|nr:hypothetical protein XFF6960_740022 [Xanthomonas citri pv. fuscans]SOO12200.1 hypothetical protein XFF7766_1010017 [Xanthomonas citri pv. fuscans]SOO45252.1 hypothetical protein XFF1815_710001 [Xanthomonas citri pv. fuscans]